MKDKEKLLLFDKVASAISGGVVLAENGKINRSWDETEKERRREMLVAARNGNGKVSFNLRTLKSNEVAVAKVTDYSILIACVATYLRELELSDHLDYLQTIHDEEVAHIVPALRDAGLIGYQMGVSFVPSRDGRGIGPIGFVHVSGRLRLSTVKKMYTNVSDLMSPSDIGMMKLIEETGI